MSKLKSRQQKRFQILLTVVMLLIMVTFSRTVIVTVLQTIITSMFAYGFSRPNLIGKRLYSALGIFTAVAMWNDYTQTLYYTRTPALQTLSYYTLSLTKSAQSAANLASSMSGTSASSVLTAMSEASSNYKTIELACMVISAIPLIIAYPFAQKYFEKGVMVGSVKGCNRYK